MACSPCPDDSDDFSMVQYMKGKNKMKEIFIVVCFDCCSLKLEYPAVFTDEDKADEYCKENNNGIKTHGYTKSVLHTENCVCEMNPRK